MRRVRTWLDSPSWNTFRSSSNNFSYWHLFAGYYYDKDTGLYLVRNRFYHAPLGRWLQKDPAGFADSLNLYEYVGSDPANLIDPTGEFEGTKGFLAPFLPRLDGRAWIGRDTSA
jgi:RHS repeat-associated protein